MRAATTAFLVLAALTTQSFPAMALEYKSLERITEAAVGGEICYRQDTGAVNCTVPTDMGEVKIRESASWPTDSLNQSYLSQLSPELRDTAAGYDLLFVRQLSLSPGATADSANFIAHIIFVYAGGQASESRTVFLSGHYDGTGVRIDSMSFSNGLEAVGALFLAATMDQANASNPAALYAAVAVNHLPLLKIGGAVVQTYLRNR